MVTNKKIVCPSCGSNSVFKRNVEEYMCNMCQKSFVPGHGPGDFSNRINQLRPLNTGYNSANKGQKLGCIVAVAVIIAVLGIGAGVFFTLKAKNKHKYLSSSFSEEGWKQPTVYKYIPFAASKGPVVWEIMRYSYSRMDSAKRTIRIVDPRTGETLTEQIYGDVTTKSEDIHFSQKLDYDFLLLNDTVYNGSEDGGLQAFDVYTGKLLFANPYFEKKYKQLNVGVVKVKSRLYKDQFVFMTKNGDEFFYYPARKLLRNKEEEDNSYKTDTITKKDFYFTYGPKSHLYLATRKEGFNDGQFISDQNVQSFFKNESYSKYFFKTLEQLGDRNFPYPQRLLSSNGSVVIAYQSDFSKTANPIIEKVDENGKTVWQNKDTALKFFLKYFSGDNLHLKFSNSKNEIIFYEYAGVNRSVGIDLKTGKTIFDHTQERKTN